MKFIHAADLHLDSPFLGLSKLPSKLYKQMKEATFNAFNRLIEEAITEQVDAVLIAGDVFDFESQSVRAQLAFENGMRKLDAAGIKTFISHGNHDHLTEHTKDKFYGSNIHVFSPVGETITFITGSGERVAVSGFSYDKRWISDNRLSRYPVKDYNVDFHLGMMHGDQYKATAANNYAPYTVNDIKRTQYDYVALGHIHTRKKILDSPLTYYSGSLQGLNRKETGPKGYILVDIEKNKKARTQFHSVSSIVWENKRLNLKDEASLSDVTEKLDDLVEKTVTNNRLVLLSVTFTQANKLDNNLRESVRSGEVAEAFAERYKGNNIYIYKLDFDHYESPELDDLKQQFPDEFAVSYQKVFDKDYFNQLTDDLFINKAVVRRIQDRDSSYINKMKKRIYDMNEEAADDY